MKSKWIAWLLALTMMVGMIAVMPAAASGAAEPATIYFWSAWTPEAGIQAVIDGFNALYPQIEVIPVQFSNNSDGNLKVDTTLAMGTGIDVFFNYGVSRLDARAQAGLLMDLDPYIQRDGFDVAAELGENIYQKDGAYVALPATSNAYCVFLNKTMLDEANLTTPVSWTIDEFYAYARQLTKGEGDTKVYGADTLRPYYQWLFMASNCFAENPWYKEDGTSNFDHPYYRKVLELKAETEAEGIQYPYIEYVSSKISTQDNFLNGSAAMAIYGNSLTRNLTNLEKYPHDFKVEVAPLPVAEDGALNYNLGGYYGYIGVNANTESPEASWLFTKYIITEGSYGFLKVGHLPTWKQTDWDSVVTDTFGENAEEFINVEQFKDVVLNRAGMPQQVNDNFTANAEINEILNTELESFIYGISDLDTTILNLKTKADEAIANAQ